MVEKQWNLCLFLYLDNAILQPSKIKLILFLRKCMLRNWNSEEIGNVESVKSIASIYAPMTGEVLEMNKAIDTDKGRPQLINRDPLGKGWILKMKATGKKTYS